MKMSELIARLKEDKEMYGDLPIVDLDDQEISYFLTFDDGSDNDDPNCIGPAMIVEF